MKTLLITKEYYPFKGGVANYYNNLVNNWPKNEDIIVMDNNEKDLDKEAGFLSWRRAVKNVYKKIREENIDYLLVGQVLPLGTVAYIISLIKPLKYAVFFHGMDLPFLLRVPRKKMIAKRILKRSDKIIAANSYVKKQLLDNFKIAEDKIKVINPGINDVDIKIDKSRKDYFIKHYKLEDKNVILSLGRLVKRKGFDKSIKALDLMKDEDLKDLIYLIAGSGPEEDYLKSLVSLKNKNRVIFLGAVSDSDKNVLYDLADMFLMPARNIDGDYEGFGIVYLEANLFSKPVIAGLAGGVSDAVLDAVNGLMVNPEDENEIKTAILKLKNDSDLRNKLGNLGRERALKGFSWENLIADLFNTIKN